MLPNDRPPGAPRQNDESDAAHGVIKAGAGRSDNAKELVDGKLSNAICRHYPVAKPDFAAAAPCQAE